MQLQQFQYTPRNCECCGGNDLQSLYNFQHTAVTSRRRWQFIVNDVICRKCGFVFVSPSPDSDQLLAYYAETYSKYQCQLQDFDSSKRIDFITSCLAQETRGVFLELGSHVKSSFHDDLKGIFKRIVTIEPNTDSESNYDELAILESRSFDVVAHYFVLEHVPEIRNFILNCHRLLKMGGIMICEVPDLAIYHKDISALVLHEHVNHFTPEKLAEICGKLGFRKIKHSHAFCSRSFGFVMAFEKSEAADFDKYPTQFLENRDAFRSGLERAAVFLKRREGMIAVIEKCRSEKKLVLIWGANDNLLRMFSGEEEIPNNVIIVDSNPKKQSFLSNRRVKLPEEIKDVIDDISVIMLMTNLHADAILNALKARFDKTFLKENVYLFDFYNPFDFKN